MENNITTSEETKIASAFNDHFSSVADKVRNKIVFNSKDFSFFLENPNLNSFFINPILAEEVFKIISTLDNKKANGPNSIPNVILKTVGEEISVVLSKLFNL